MSGTFSLATMASGPSTPHHSFPLMIGTLGLVLLVGAPVLSTQQEDRALRTAMLEAEDTRAEGPEGLAPLLQGLRSPNPETQRLAVRALGRLERVSLVPSILPLLTSRAPAVRAEAANALGQSVVHGNANMVTSRLIDRLRREEDPVVGGTIAQTLGRLPYGTLEEVRAAEQALLAYSRLAPLTSLWGIVRGFESLMRSQAEAIPPSMQSIARLTQLAREGLVAPDSQAAREAARVRRLAVAALIAGGRTSVALVDTTLSDPDPEVRRLAAAAIRSLEAPPPATLVAAGLADRAPRVRYEALRTYGERLRADSGCGPISRHVRDPDPHVALLAIDLLEGCEQDDLAADLLDSIAGELSQREGGGTAAWRRPAHALVALAGRAPDRADSHLAGFAQQAIWQARMYAARTATRLGDHETLVRLAFDNHPNVRESSIRGLVAIKGHDTDSAYITALDSPDYQLVRTAARALEGTPNGAVTVPALISALARITTEQRETSRDPRRAIVDRLGELGDMAQVEALRPYLTDFDPVIATAVAEHLSAWTGEPHVPMPAQPPRAAIPSLDELARLDGGRAVIRMAGGGTIELRLRPFDAPTNTARFARLADDGYFDGLTFHRVVPNFVIQGGSPGANEFMGAGPYARDELTARSHLRGTVGISTRGRDTGDAQIFVNLVDNVRLDHNYTIIAEVVSGMEIIDDVQEGASMQRVIIERR